mgnify:CR=1 FL=1
MGQNGVEAFRILAGDLKRRGKFHADAGIVQESGPFLVHQFLVPVDKRFAGFRHDEAGLFPANLIHQGEQGESQAEAVEKEGGLIGSLNRSRRHGCRRFIASVGKAGRCLYAVAQKKVETVPFP